MKSRAITATLALALSACAFGRAFATVDPRQVTIDFDDIAAPPSFGQTVRLTNTYTPQGVTFSGEVGESGMAVLDSTGFFNVSGQSLPNVLIANPTQMLADFGIPRTPETLTFNPPIHSFSIRAMTSDPAPNLHIYFSVQTTVGGEGALPQALGNTFQTYTFTGDDITSIVIDTDAAILILDDLTFIPGPANDQCANAKVITPGSWFGSTAAATHDGDTACGSSPNAIDVWYSFTPAQSGTMRLSTAGSVLDTILSVHSDCPGSSGNTLACNDDGPIESADLGGTVQSELTYEVTSGQTYLIRVAGYGTSKGNYVLNLTMPDDRPDPGCGLVAAFPSAQTSVVSYVLYPFASPTEIGYFYSAADGHSLTQQIRSDRLEVDHMILDFDVTTNSLNSTLGWDIRLNGTVVGVFNIAGGATGPQHLEFSFPAIARAGVGYTIKMEVVTEGVGGAIGFGYSGANAGYVQLSSAVTERTAVDTDRGYWTSTGDHTAATDNVFVGHDPTLKGYNGFFVFDTKLLTSVRQATLRFEVESYFSTDPSETIGVYDVLSDIGLLSGDGTGMTSFYNDLQSGDKIAEFTVTAADVGSVIEVPVTGFGVDYLNQWGYRLKTPVGLHLMNQRADAESEAVRFAGSSEPRIDEITIGYCPSNRRAFGDFDNSGCTDITDFLYLLDYWNLTAPIGAPAIGISDFLALLDYWNLGPSCP